MQKKILLVDPDREQTAVFTNWLREEGYAVEPIDDLKEIHSSISTEKFDILLIDLDYHEITETSLEPCHILKKDPRFKDLPIAIVTYKQDGNKIAGALESGVDYFILKPFETDSFLERVKTIFKEIELKRQEKKALDLNYINFLIKLTYEANRNNFFILAPVIFNKLIIDKIKPVIGDNVVAVMVKRTKEQVSKQYPFMKAVELSGSKLLMGGVDKDSMEVDIEGLATAFREYVYAFLHLVRMLTSTILIEEMGSKEKDTVERVDNR